MIKVGIVGGAGYTAGELIRILVNHPQVDINFIFSTSSAGKKVYEVHQDLFGQTEIEFSGEINAEIDALFLCLGHGNSKQFLENNSFSESTKIIDLSTDFRPFASNFEDQEFVYGLPEFQKEAIKQAQNIANPGCFATAIQLALLPLAQKGLLNSSVHINATTGATGAGVSPSPTTHFSWRDNNFSVYKAFTHQHLNEIKETLNTCDIQNTKDLFFIPNRGNFSRGIFASIYLETDLKFEEAESLFEDYYADEPFTQLISVPVHLKQVVNTNQCFINLQKLGNHLLITTAIDNLLKGASGQAVQNMNLMFGLEETIGLQLKASTF
jgi:N-acetyl-gamma-glutamyl-phosphate reductase